MRTGCTNQKTAAPRRTPQWQNAGPFPPPSHVKRTKPHKHPFVLVGRPTYLGQGNEPETHSAAFGHSSPTPAPIAAQPQMNGLLLFTSLVSLDTTFFGPWLQCGSWSQLFETSGICVCLNVMLLQKGCCSGWRGSTLGPTRGKRPFYQKTWCRLWTCRHPSYAHLSTIM